MLERIKSKEQLQKGEAFTEKTLETGKAYGVVTSGVRYDLVAKLLGETRLTRKTIVNILTGIKKKTFDLFKKTRKNLLSKQPAS